MKSPMHGDPSLHDVGSFHVPGLGPRGVRVYLPPRGRSERGTASGDEPLPVLYMFDGQNVFDDAPSYAGGWRLHESTRRISPRLYQVPVIVGLHHGGQARIDELSPWKGPHGGGQADVLLDWLTRELMPELGRRFHLATAPEDVMIGGSSMGGLCALYAHFRHPETFGGALSMSPSLWFGGLRIFDYVASRPTPRTSRIYLDAGAHEASGGVLRLAERMARLLGGRGYGAGELCFRADPKGKHNEMDWRRRAPKALRFLFRKAH
jgi:predicted alpha/beta superfamily hydrolase